MKIVNIDLKTKLQELISSYEDDLRKWEDGYYFVEKVDAVCFGGGFGDADSWDFLLRDNAEYIRSYIKSGGTYLGICMGAYWAGQTYFDILDNVDVVQYIKQPGTCTRRPHAKNMPIIWDDYGEQNMFFYDGPTFVGKGQYDTISTYRNSGMPMAIIQNNIGLIGCHPEATEYWYDNYSWMKRKFKSKHNLLLEFVDEVVN